MAETKYVEYIKNLTFSDDGPGLYRQGTKMSGEFLGLDVNIQYGTYWAAGRMGREPYGSHRHDFDQVILWMGADTDDLGELGAEVELCLGEEMEKHMITTSTAVFVPKSFSHFPATVTRMDKRFLFMVVSCAPEYNATSIPSDKGPTEPVGWQSKHGNHILHLSFERKGAWHYGPKNRDDAGGSITMVHSQDFDCSMMYESIKKAPYRFGPVPDKPHVHSYHEILLFIGADVNDLSELGGEAEMSLGKEMERHIITTPTAVVLPRGFPHCPLAITKLDKPFIFAVVRPFGAEDTAQRPP
jgi:hypothetical protein